VAYASLAQLKEYLGLTDSSEDELLTRLLEAATATIESYTGYFFAAQEATRYYTAEDAIHDTLLLGDIACSISQVTDGDGNVIPAEQYVLLPPRGPRYHAIRLVRGSWSPNEAGYVARVTASWGWSLTPPADIVQACIRLAAYFYRLRDAQVFDVTAQPQEGQLAVPKGIPADVKAILDRYRRVW
jgi:uncharacterized phiE125 gp8 family phage protein